MSAAATRTAKKLFIFAIAMFGFGYAMVPLYNVFCDVTGLRLKGKTGEITETVAATVYVDPNRLVTVAFDTNVNSALPWRFKAQQYTMKVHPGVITEAVFVVENNSNATVIGRAVPSVVPTQAALFFNKTECFCFTKQTLTAGERKEIVVRFVVDSKLPKKINTMTLSYTFYEAADSKNVAQSDSNTVKAIDIKS